MSNMEVLGQGMVEAGNEFGPTGAYGNKFSSKGKEEKVKIFTLERDCFLLTGSMLIKVGTSQLKLGQTERDYITVAVNSFVDPLNRFLDNEVKNATKERRTLEVKR